MRIFENHSLKPYNTFGINVNAESFASVKTLEELTTTLKNKPSKILIIGGGSNILLTEDFEGLVLHIDLKGIEVCKKQNETTIVKVSAGETGTTLYCGP